MYCCIYSPFLWVITMRLNYQRVLNFTTELAKQAMNHYSFVYKNTKHGLGEDKYLWINEKRRTSNKQHVGTGCKLVNITELPEAIDEAERNWLNHSMTWGWRQCVSCLEFNFSSSLLQHDSRKSSDVSLLNSISWGSDHFNSGGENKQALRYLKFLLSNLLLFTICFNKRSKRVYLYHWNNLHLYLTAKLKPVLATKSVSCYC